jgi:hypothetical protein
MNAYPLPAKRRLRTFAFDPSLAGQLETAAINQITLEVPWEPLEPGPVGEYLEVVDVDPASGQAYWPVDLNEPFVLAQDGLAPSEGDPRFHQQMVYAVAMATIKRFEEALGRRALWSVPRRGSKQWKYIPRLRIYPHALREANAYYSPDKKALLFGYFRATAAQGQEVLPGGLVFTCLSHDIIAHETTHALLDGMHRRFAEPSNPDVLAFHEALADIVALFQHFSYPEALRHQLARTRGDLSSQNLLGELAQQFGQAIGSHGALRNALGTRDAADHWHPKTPDPLLLSQTAEPHARGSVLVAAVFGAFLRIYQARTADLLRIASAGTGVLPEGELHPDLVNRLAQEAATTAHHVLRMCIRALDYCPPVDITFGEFLRAIVTADRDLVANDSRNYRVAVVESFRRWGIYPAGVNSLSEESLLWSSPTKAEQEAVRKALGDAETLRGYCPDWGLSSERRSVYDQSEKNKESLQKALVKTQLPAAVRALGMSSDLAGYGSFYESSYYAKLGFKNTPTLEVHAVRPARRVLPNGEVRTDLVVIATQRRRGYFSPERQQAIDSRTEVPVDDEDYDFMFRGGCTLLIDLETGNIRFIVRKDVLDEQRMAAHRSYLLNGLTPNLQGMYFGARGKQHAEGLAEPFAFLHRIEDTLHS